MSTRYPLSTLDRAITLRADFIQINDTEIYKRCKVQLHAQGIVLRDIVSGAEIKTKRQQVCRVGEFLVAEIDAKVGGFGIVPVDLDGAIVSSHYFLFEINDELLNHRYLDFYGRTHAFQRQVSAQGSTNYAAIRPKDVLGYTIPLPPLAEQRRIVARIEELAAKIEAARGLRRETVEEVGILFSSAMNVIWSDQSYWASQPVMRLATTVSGQVDPRIEPYASLPHINGEVMESGTGKLLSSYHLAKEDGVISGKYLFPAGSVLYSKIRPYLRKSVEVPFEGVCSADVYAFDKINPEIESRFFMYSLIAPPFTDYANLLSGRTRMPKINQSQLQAFIMSYPPILEQRRIVTYLDSLQTQVGAMKALHAETGAELNALLPAVLDRAFKGEL